MPVAHAIAPRLYTLQPTRLLALVADSAARPRVGRDAEHSDQPGRNCACPQQPVVLALLRKVVQPQLQRRGRQWLCSSVPVQGRHQVLVPRRPCRCTGDGDVWSYCAVVVLVVVEVDVPAPVLCPALWCWQD